MGDNPYYAGPAGIISAPSALPRFPHLRDFDGKDPFNLRHVRSVFARAPWFDVHAYRDVELVKRYVSAGVLPGGIPVRALDTPDWDLHCAVPLSALGRRRDDAEKRALWAQMIYKRMRRTIGEVLIDPSLGLDTWHFRTDGEIRPATRLAGLNFVSWAGLVGVRQDALLVDKPLLRAEFRYLRKNDSAFWRVNMRWERAVRNRLGYLVPHQMTEIDLMRASARPSRYVPVTADFQAVEVPLGCCAELPPEVTYLGTELRQNLRSGLWVPFFSGWTARVAVYLLWDVYDTCRLWYLPPTLCSYMRILDLSLPLGSTANYRELLELINVLEHVQWELVPEDQRKRGAPRRSEFSPGRRGPGGDFIWYDPWTKTHLSCEAARALRDNPRVMPAGTPYGYVFEPDPALYAEDEEDEPMEDPDEDPVEVAVHDSVEEQQARGSTPVPPGSSASHAARRDSRGNPLASSEGAQKMETIVRFLRDAGISPQELGGSYDDLVRFSASRLGDKRERGRTEAPDLDGRNEKFRRGAEDGERRRD